MSDDLPKAPKELLKVSQDLAEVSQDFLRVLQEASAVAHVGKASPTRYIGPIFHPPCFCGPSSFSPFGPSGGGSPYQGGRG